MQLSMLQLGCHAAVILLQLGSHASLILLQLGCLAAVCDFVTAGLPCGCDLSLVELPYSCAAVQLGCHAAEIVSSSVAMQLYFISCLGFHVAEIFLLIFIKRVAKGK